MIDGITGMGAADLQGALGRVPSLGGSAPPIRARSVLPQRPTILVSGGTGGSSLPPELLGASITVTPKRGMSSTATVLEVLERCARRMVVRSGRASK